MTANNLEEAYQKEAYQRFSEWQERAEDDVNIMEIALKEDGAPNPICFHAQQAAEKYLKGFLAFHSVEFAKVYSLIDLLDRCMKIEDDFVFKRRCGLSQYILCDNEIPRRLSKLFARRIKTSTRGRHTGTRFCAKENQIVYS